MGAAMSTILTEQPLMINIIGKSAPVFTYMATSDKVYFIGLFILWRSLMAANISYLKIV
jgi:hypothetical protein